MSPTAESSRVERSSSSRIAVIEKVVKVLDTLMLTPTGMTPTDVAAAIGSNRSTAFRLLTSLDQAGVLEHDGATGRYRLGVKFLQYGECVRAGTGLVDVAEPILRRLSADTRQSATLAIREGFGARSIHRVAGPEVDIFAWRVGEWLPMHLGAAPQALLSALPDVEVDRFIAQGGEHRTLHGVLTDEDIRESVRATRERGWSLNQEGLTTGVISIGTVVHNASGTPACAISVAGLKHHYEGELLDQNATTLVEAARELGWLLG